MQEQHHQPTVATPCVTTHSKYPTPVKQPAASLRGCRPSSPFFFTASTSSSCRRCRSRDGYPEDSTQAVFELVQGCDELRRVRTALFRASLAAATHERNLLRYGSGGERQERGGKQTYWVTTFHVVHLLRHSGIFEIKILDGEVWNLYSHGSKCSTTHPTFPASFIDKDVVRGQRTLIQWSLAWHTAMYCIY